MEVTIYLPEDADRTALLGSAERNLKMIREALGVRITARDHSVRVSGEGQAVNRAATILSELADAARRRKPLNRVEVLDRLHRISTQPDGWNGDSTAASRPMAPESPPGMLDVYARGQRVQAITSGQLDYLAAMRAYDMVFCLGPAGTGKTYLAVAMAVASLKRSAVKKIVLVRPAVEAGERLGFLPGDMQEKVNPYVRPLLDALHDMMPFDQVQRFMNSDLIEIVPLAFMRGRTLNDAIIILDEAQNTTVSQMLMFLTRMGQGSRMIITGDTSQVDLEPGVQSGLIDASRRLRRIPGVRFVTLEKGDIVRHSLVQQVVEAYGQDINSRMMRTPDIDDSETGQLFAPEPEPALAAAQAAAADDESEALKLDPPPKA